MANKKTKLGHAWRNFLLAIAVLVVLFVGVLYYLWTLTSTAAVTARSATLNGNFPVASLKIIGPSGSGWIHSGYVYLALNYTQWTRGYMNQSSLGDCDGKSPCIGMDFIFPNYTNVCFWMKNTYIPLKMVWINTTGHINGEYNDTPQDTVPVCQNAQSVMEVAPNYSIPFGSVVVVNTT